MNSSISQVSASSDPDVQGLSARLSENRLNVEVEADLVAAHCKMFPMGLVPSMVTAGFLVLALWGAVPGSVLVAWLALLWATYISRAFAYASYTRKAKASASLEISRWTKRFALGAAIAGCMWGSAGVLMYVPDSVMHQMLLIVILTAISSGAALGVMVHHLPSFYAFVIPIVPPVLVRFLLEADTLHVALAGLCGLVFAFAIVSGRNFNKLVVESFRLRREFDEQQAIAERARQDAEMANLEKSRFLAAASHDLRQPLHALGLLIAALRARIHHGEEREIVAKVERSLDAMNGLFNALLDISKLDAGAIKPNIGNVCLRSLFSRIETDFTQEAAGKGLKLRIAACNQIVRSDALLLERIVRNLVSNALRYTESGSIFVGCRRRDGWLRIDVRDSGIGIPQAQQQSIFEEFYQLNNPERDRSKGLGLGLAIIKRLSTLLTHPIHVSSRPEKGSTFTVDVPLAQKGAPVAVHSNEVKVEADSKIDGAFILVVDDEADVLESTRIVLEDWGCHVLTASSGAEALRKLPDHIRAPDVIVSDYRLREGEIGIEVIRQVQAQLDDSIPGILVTGDFNPARIDEAAVSGMQLLHKPVHPATLRHSLQQALVNRPDFSGELGV